MTLARLLLLLLLLCKAFMRADILLEHDLPTHDVSARTFCTGTAGRALPMRVPSHVSPCCLQSARVLIKISDRSTMDPTTKEREVVISGEG
jgi:hypothetical protein